MNVKECNGQEIIEEGTNSVIKKYDCSKLDIVESMQKNEICEDVQTAINHIIALGKS